MYRRYYQRYGDEPTPEDIEQDGRDIIQQAEIVIPQKPDELNNEEITHIIPAQVEGGYKEPETNKSSISGIFNGLFSRAGSLFDRIRMDDVILLILILLLLTGEMEDDLLLIILVFLFFTGL